MAARTVEVVPLSKIDPPGEAQRTSIDPTKIIELAESIREKGLQDPILLRPQNGRYEIVYGHRRFLAHQHLGVATIEAFIREMDDSEMIVVRGIENLQRENLSPMEEARVYYLLKTRGGMSNYEICRQTGKQKQTVLRYLRLYDWPPEFQAAIDGKKISFNVADQLIDIDDPQMRLYYLNMAIENGITERVAEMWLSDYKKSLQGTLGDEMGGVQGVNVVPEAKPIFYTCQGCLGPVEMGKAKQVILCPDCAKRVRG